MNTNLSLELARAVATARTAEASAVTRRYARGARASGRSRPRLRVLRPVVVR